MKRRERGREGRKVNKLFERKKIRLGSLKSDFEGKEGEFSINSSK